MRRLQSRLAATTAVLVTLLAPASEALELPPELGVHDGKVLIVDFWASWCTPCRRSFPWLEAMQRKYADNGLVVIGVNEDGDQSAAAAFLDEVPVTFRIVPDPDGLLATHFELMAMPASFWIGRDGDLADAHLGFRSADTGELESRLRVLLGLPDAPAPGVD